MAETSWSGLLTALSLVGIAVTLAYATSRVLAAGEGFEGTAQSPGIAVMPLLLGLGVPALLGIGILWFEKSHR